MKTEIIERNDELEKLGEFIRARGLRLLFGAIIGIVIVVALLSVLFFGMTSTTAEEPATPSAALVTE